MKAAVFCNFPDEYSERLRTQLNNWGIEIRHWSNISQSTEMKDPEVDLVIGFIELMSHGQSGQAKALAQRWGARWVPLTRKVASWARFLPPPQERSPHVGAPLLVDMANGPAAEPGMLEWGQDGPPPQPAFEVPKPPESSPSPVSMDQQWDEIRELFAGEVEELKAKNTALAKENHDLKMKVERSELTESQLYELASDEEKRLKARISQLEGEIEKLRTGSLESLGGAIRTLVSSGFLEEREAADRLLNMVLGRRR